MGSTSFNNMNAQLAALLAALNAAGNAGRNAGAGARNASAGFLGLAGSIGKTVAMTAGLTVLTAGVAGLAATFTDASDAAGLMNAKLSIAYSSATALAQANRDVRAIANSTRSDLVAIADLYAMIGNNAKALGMTQGQVTLATKTFAQTLKIAGANAQQTSSSMTQLSQAFAANRMDGEGLNTLRDANRVFIDQLAASMGVASGAMKKLVEEGKVTGEELKKALTDPKIIETMEAQFGRIPVTFQDIRTGIGNMMVDVAGAIKKGLGIDDSMAVLLAKVNAFAKSSLPTFERIGASLREAFDSIAPVARTAFAVLGTALGFVVNNLSTLIGLTKVAGAAWIAFKAAGAVSTLSAMLGQVIALNMALGATGPVSALFAAGMKLVQGAVRGVTAALLANPFTALAVGITAVIALLYEFSDKIKIGGGSIASLSSLVQSFAETVGPLFTAIGNTVSKVFTSIGEIASAVFGGLLNTVAPFFRGFDLSIAGLLRFFGRAVDLLVSVWNFGVAAMKQGFSTFPAVITFGFSTAFNSAAGMIETFANGAIGAINLLISAANAMGASFDKINPVKLERVAAVMPKIKDAGQLWGESRSTAGSAFIEGRIGRANEIERLKGRDRKDQPDLANLGTDTKTITATDDDAKKKADEAAKKLAEIQAKYDEFFVDMTEQAKLAGMLPVEAERYNKELELRKILGDGELKNARELNDAEKKRIADALQLKALSEVMRDIKIAERDALFENTRLEEQKRIIANGTLAQVAENLAVEEKLAKFKKAAMDSGIDLENAQFKAALATLGVRERENYLLAQRNRLQSEGLERATDYAKEALGTDGTHAERLGVAAKEKATAEQYIREALTANRITTGEYHAAMRRVNREHTDRLRYLVGEFYDGMIDSVYRIANTFEGVIGKVAGNLGRVLEGLKGIDQATGGGITKVLKGAFGEKFMKDVSKKFGAAMAGAEFGAATADLASALGIKGYNKTGASIGGAIGSFAGPIGSIVGSFAGGIIGGIVNKPKSTTSSLTGGGAGGVNTTGSKKYMEGVSGAAGSVQSGLQEIADRLGGSIGNFSVAIGMFNGMWRVNKDATNKQLHSKNFGKDTLTNFGDDADAAIKYAIQDAIKDGAIVGVSDFVSKALKRLDVDAAFSLIDAFNEITKSLDAMNDPLGSAVRDINTSLDSLVKRMQGVGASSSDLAKVEEYRSKKLAEAYASGMKTLTDFRDALNGEGTGVTDLTRLTGMLGKFDAFKADIALGKQIDQAAFTGLGSDIMGLASSVWGTSTKQFQDIRQMLTDATQGALEVYQAAYDDATTKAINTQTEAVTNQIAITNELLRQQIELTERQLNSNGGVRATDYERGNVINDLRMNYV